MQAMTWAIIQAVTTVAEQFRLWQQLQGLEKGLEKKCNRWHGTQSRQNLSQTASFDGTAKAKYTELKNFEMMITNLFHD